MPVIERTTLFYVRDYRTAPDGRYWWIGLTAYEHVPSQVATRYALKSIPVPDAR